MNNKELYKSIVIDFVPIECQRYITLGDYMEEDGKYHIKITIQDDFYHALAIALHEFVEWFLTMKRGILESDIMKYDLYWEELEKEGKNIADEPGYEPSNNIYRKEHEFSELIERLFIRELGYDWKNYEKQVMNSI